MTPFRSCVALVILILLAGALCGAEPKRSRVFTNAENGLELRVVVNTDGAGRTEVVLSLTNAGKRHVEYFPFEKKGVPCSLGMLTTKGEPVPTKDRALNTFSLPSSVAWLAPGDRVEATFVLEEYFACEKTEEPLTLVAQRWLLEKEQRQWTRLEVTVPNVRRAVEDFPPTDD